MRLATALAPIAVALLLTGCQAPPPRAAGDGSHAANVTASAAIHGRATYLERMSLPAGAVLEVQLIADDPAGTPTTIAHASFGNLHGPPYDFTLPYAPADIRQGMHYALRAMLRDTQGRLQFVTPSGVTVVPGDAKVVEFRLVRASAGG